MESNAIATERLYFAAANGYGGFRSYFDRIFDSKDYERVFVLKGGPGTGKSTLMKKVLRDFSGESFKTEAILCSSDPHSLDGVIVEREGRRIAVLDGTAPHERDAIIPGAVDELVDLADALRAEDLVARRWQILSLNEQKKRHFEMAYQCLSACKKENEDPEKTGVLCQKDALRSYLGALLPARLEAEGVSSLRLIRSFGACGETLLPTFSRQAERCYLFIGEKTENEICMREVLRLCAERGLSVTVAPSPYEEDRHDGILINRHATAFLAVGNAGIRTEISPFFTERSGKSDLSSHALAEAQSRFALAARCHFALERIYGEALEHSVLNEKADRILKSMHILLD